jgi:KTSC domain
MDQETKAVEKPKSDIPRAAISSSNVKSIGYQAGTLAVEFRNGAIYHYAGVPADVHQALMAAQSKGSYIAVHLRDKFKAMRIV